MKRCCQRRDALQREAEGQRRLLAGQLQAMRPALGWLTPVVSIGRIASRHPALTALLGMALLRVIRRRRWWRLAGAVGLAWRGLSLLRRFLRAR